jgi:hypothetical protein
LFGLLQSSLASALVFARILTTPSEDPTVYACQSRTSARQHDEPDHDPLNTE